MTRIRFAPGSVVLVTLASTACADASPQVLMPGVVSGETPLSRNHGVQPAKTLTYFETTNAISDQISVLARLRAWRGTLSGNGPRAQRSWNISSVGQNKLQLALGAQQLPALRLANLPASAVGTSVRVGRIAAGSTWRPRDVDELAQKYDAAMTGAAPPALNAPRMTWLSARPIESSSGNLDLLHARRTSNGSERQLTGARGEWNAPLRWKVNGEWNQSGDDTAEARAWNLGAAGPVRHPWGEASATAQFQTVNPGFHRWDDSSAEAARVGSLALQQNVAIGDVSGTLLMSLSQTQRLSDVIAQNAALTEEAQNKADLRWKLSPSFSIIARQSLKTTAQQIEAPPIAETAPTVEDTPGSDGTTQSDVAESAVSEPTSTETSTPPVDSVSGESASESVGAAPLFETRRSTWQIARERSGEAGLEWKLSRTLGVTATAGQTRTERSLIGGDFLSAQTALVPGEDERNRLALALQRRTKGGAWSIGLARQLQDTPATQPLDFTRDDVQLAAERNLGPGIKLKGTLGLANSFVSETLAESRTTRNIEAQWSLGAGRVDVRLGDWNGLKPGSSGVQLDGAKEWTARLNLGSAAKGAGLGLAVEYSERELQNSGPIPTWRVGVTYK